MRGVWCCLLVMLVTPVILACGGMEGLAEMAQPVPAPPEHLPIVGTWVGDEVTLSITADGMLSHETHGGGASTSFRAPVREWKDGAVVAGLGPVVQSFELEGPMEGEDGQTVLVVNGTPLVRQ